MDALPATQDDSSGANPSSVKSDDSTPPHESGRGSPPPNCAICLGTCRNKSFTDSCLHQFCFKCLLTWSKVKAECPLCKQNFRSIIHNVRSNHQYEEYMVEQRHTEETTERIDIDNLTATRRFRYRTTLTLPRRETLAIQQLLVHYPHIVEAFPRAPPARRRRSPASFRRTVYRHNLWARPLPDFTGRYRDCSPEFYRYNDSQMHRLVPWLSRELNYLLNENVGHISYVMTRILELLPQYHITSPEFREAMQRYFGERTEHFLHELFCFASTPYDMTGYDRNVQYTTDSRISTMVNEVISSSDSEASVDSDIVMVSTSEPADAPPGPSRVPLPLPPPLPVPAYPQSYIPPPPVDNVIPIETISHSDTDDDSVMVVGYIKPPQDRTPEVVDLLGSDSDVIVQETVPAEPAQGTSRDGERATGFNALDFVKLSLKRHWKRSHDSDSDESYRPSPSPPRARRRLRSNDTATTSDTSRTTPSPHYDYSPPPSPPCDNCPAPSPPCDNCPAPSPPPALAPAAPSPTYTPPTSPRPALPAAPIAGGVVSDHSATTSTTTKRKRTTRKKSKRKDHRDSPSDRNKKKCRKRSRSRSHHRERRNSPSGDAERDKRSKQKSHSGKGVKSSKKSATETVPAPEPTAQEPEQAGPSGAGAGRPRPRSQRSERERDRRRASRENRRLRSVVNIMYRHSKSTDSSPSRNSSANSYDTQSNSSYKSIPNSGSVTSEDSSRTVSYEPHSFEGSGSNTELPADRQGGTDDFDSDDNLPLNLTVQKTYPFSEM